MSLGALCGLNQAERLLRLNFFLKEAEAELGEQSNSSWSTRCAIARCLLQMGEKSEAVIILKLILDQCPTLEGDMRLIVKGASHLLSTVFLHEKLYRDLRYLY